MVFTASFSLRVDPWGRRGGGQVLKGTFPRLGLYHDQTQLFQHLKKSKMSGGPCKEKLFHAIKRNGNKYYVTESESRFKHKRGQKLSWRKSSIHAIIGTLVR
jgi:hypothetical protein